MRQSAIFLQNAENCSQLAENAKEEPAKLRYQRMEQSWRALANEQKWLDAEIPPA
jgi:hypothetical protein